jgi:hypothetical protein
LMNHYFQIAKKKKIMTTTFKTSGVKPNIWIVGIKQEPEIQTYSFSRKPILGIYSRKVPNSKERYRHSSTGGI